LSSLPYHSKEKFFHITVEPILLEPIVNPSLKEKRTRITIGV
jgi:hypothetical protein